MYLYNVFCWYLPTTTSFNLPYCLSPCLPSIFISSFLLCPNVLCICTWAWGHPLEEGQPTSDHVFKGEWPFRQPSNWRTYQWVKLLKSTYWLPRKDWNFSRFITIDIKEMFISSKWVGLRYKERVHIHIHEDYYCLFALVTLWSKSACLVLD